MKLNPKVTGALAWTGLVVVLAIPAADMLGGRPTASTTMTSDTDQVQTATVKPTVVRPAAIKPVASPAATETAAASADPVSDFVKSGKPLPSYISGSDSPAPQVVTTPAVRPGTITVNPDGTITRPAPTPTPTPTTVTPAEPQVATVPNLVPPQPLPASARPRPQALPQPVITPEEPPLIIDEPAVASRGPVPLVDIVPQDQVITGDQLEEWDSGSLADYLARRGLLADDAPAPRSSDSYDPDGFFLSDGPNNSRRSRVIIIDEDPIF